MRILSVIGSLAHGGAETMLVELVRGLGGREHRVLHFSAANGIVADPALVEPLAAAGVACLDADWRCLASAATVQTVLGDFTPDVVLFHWWGQDPWRPWVDESRGQAPARRRPHFVAVLHHAEIRPAPIYDHYVLVSDSQRAQVADVPAARVRVIRNGLDPARFDPIRARPDDTMVVGRISSLRPGKIPADWVRTAAGYQVPAARFVIAGEGALRVALLGDVQALGLERQFDLPGHVPRPEVPRLLQRFDVFCYVTSTTVECCPLALLEALAAGVPIVAEARGGIPELVQSGVNGLLGGSAAEVGRQLHMLRRDPGLRGRLAAGARRSAEAFTLSRQLAAYERLLGDIERSRAAAAADWHIMPAASHGAP